MKLQEIVFKQPVKVFQIFRNVNVYGKSKKSFEERKVKAQWNTMYSKSGHVFNNELYLPEQILSDPDLLTCDLITQEDNNELNSNASSDLRFTKVIGSNLRPCYNHCFHLTRTIKFEIFEIKQEDDIDLYLQYGYFEVGIPKRENFKLCVIKKNSPIEIKINGKTDFSASSGRTRIFKEQAYLFDYIGDFEKCKILKEPYDHAVKCVPTERKVVDLIKQLW